MLFDLEGAARRVSAKINTMARSKSYLRGLFVLFILAGLVGIAIAPKVDSVNAAPQQVVSTSIVISQVYGGGGNSGATLKNDFIELHNLGSSPVDVSSWSVQYASDTGSGWAKTNLSGTIQPGQYYLIQEAVGSGGTVDLPTPDVIGTIAMAASAGKIALVNNSTLLNTACPSGVVDFLGYGTTANCFEGAGPAPAPGNTTADIRSNDCTDTDDNSVDFAAVAPTPRNSSSPIKLCMDPLTVTAVANLTGTAASNLTATASAVNATGTAAANLTATACASATGYHSLLINEVAWMGTKANSSDEWIELYNPSACSIDLTNGWSLVGINSYYYTSTSYNFAISFPADSKTGAHIIINPNGYLVIAADANVFQASSITFTPFVPDSNTTPWTLANNYESLKLVSPSSTTVDTANAYATSYYGNYYWPAGTSSPNYASMERYHNLDDGPGGWVTYANPNTPSTGPKDSKGNLIQGTPGGPNWAYNVATITPSPMPTATKKIKTPTPFPPTPAPKLAINEFLPRAGHDWNNDGQINVYDEFIEIENVGVINVSLSGWSLSDDPNIGGKRYSLPAQTIKPGQRMVFYGSTTGILLIDSGDSVRLTNSRGVIVDARTYGPVEAADQSYCRIPDGIGYWTHPCFPTPGNENALTGVAPVQPTSIAIEPTPCLLADTVPGPFVQAICDAFGADVWNQNYWNQLAGQSDFPVQDNYSKWQTTVR